MRRGMSDGKIEESERLEELEEAATALLRAAGAFRRGQGVRSPRAQRESWRRCDRWEEWHDREVVEPGRIDPWKEVEAVAQAAALDPEEAAVFALSRAEERSLREMAALLGVTVYRVRVLLLRAMEKCREAALEGPLSPQALFWEEVRRKQAAIYRPPGHSWRKKRTIG